MWRWEEEEEGRQGRSDEEEEGKSKKPSEESSLEALLAPSGGEKS